MTLELAIDPQALVKLCQAHGLDLVLLYGSQASGHTHADSDVDVGVLRWGSLIPSADYLEIYQGLSEIIRYGDLDLVDLNRVPGLLKHIACERGLVLYESRPGIFAHFRVLAWNIYQDERIQIRRHDAEAIKNALRSLIK